MTFQLARAIAASPWRFLKSVFASPERGIVPLELSAACIEREQLTDEELNEVRELRIPEACVAALSGMTMSRSGGAVAILLNCAILAYMAWASRAEFFVPGLGRWLYPSLVTVALLAFLAATVAWCRRPSRDVRKRALREEEGELKSKWSKTREHEDGSKSVLFRVRIGRRSHEIGSSYLFGALGAGVRYRLYLSKYAGKLVAIESIEAIDGAVGYRTGPGRRPARADELIRRGNDASVARLKGRS